MGEKQPYCGFCGKHRDEVFTLVGGLASNPMTFICDECVDLCGEIVKERKAAAPHQ